MSSVPGLVEPSSRGIVTLGWNLMGSYKLITSATADALMTRRQLDVCAAVLFQYGRQSHPVFF